MKQWIKDFVHNCIIHPIMPFIPRKWGDELHDRNANWAFGLNRFDELKLETPPELDEKILAYAEKHKPK